MQYCSVAAEGRTFQLTSTPASESCLQGQMCTGVPQLGTVHCPSQCPCILREGLRDGIQPIGPCGWIVDVTCSRYYPQIQNKAVQEKKGI